jgi:ABC-type multidrug transport system fused ATPase/permease subunit
MKNRNKAIKRKEERDGKAYYSVWQNVKYIVANAWLYDKGAFVLFGMFTIVSSIYPFIGIMFPKFILDELLTTKDMKNLVLLLAIFFVSSSALGFGTSYLSGANYARMIGIRMKFLGIVANKCMTTDFKNTEDPKFLNDMSTSMRALEYDDAGIEGVLHKLFALGSGILTLIGYVLLIGNLNVLVLLYIILSVSITYYFTLKVKKYEHQKEEEISDIERHVKYTYDIMYDFSYGKDMRIYGIRNWISSLYRKYKNKRYHIAKDIRVKNLKINVVNCILILLREGIVYGYLIYLVITNKLGIGSFTMYFAAIASLANHMKVIVEDIAHINAQNLYINDLRDFIEKKEETEPTNPMRLPKGPFQLEFKNVYFKYPGSEKYVYEDISFVIKAGQKLAIVGHNGAGKTTFIKLLCRMYEPESGEILLNGVNIKKFSKKEYFTLISAVFQEVKTMAFSVAENIAGSESYNEDKVLKSLEKAGMKEKVLSTKNGIKTSMLKILDDEGVEFSGGETQRIILARALYKDAGIVVLDEPTAALDAIAEKNIYEKFNSMVEDKTAIFISHRLASTSFCDVIAMFEHGKLVEYGTHDELLERGGKYADMFNVQAQYYREDETEYGESNDDLELQIS